MSDYIPEEHVLQILKLLPVQSLLRFRCVSKEWKQLIDSPSFVQEHFSLQRPSFLVQSPEEYFVVDPDALPSIKRLNSPIELPEYSLLGTHHGVVCLSDSPGPNILLWNPSIRKFSTPIRIPSIVGDRANSISKGCYGFWIDPSTKEFKILAHHCFFGQIDDSVCVLYSSIRKDWRFISQPELRDWVSIISDPPLMIDGVAHWRGFHNDLLANGVILSFDFVLERFEHIQMPDTIYIGTHMCHSKHFLWKGNLSVLFKNKSGSRYEMYTRQQGEWVKIFAFNLPLPHTRQFARGIHSVFLVLVKEETRWALVSVNGNVFLLDTTRAVIIPLVDEFSNDLALTEDYVANDFVESLLFPSDS